MAINLTTADKALKTYYLDAVSEQLDMSNPFLAQIKKTTDNVYGKEIKKLAVYGINGGIGAGTEDGTLPTSTGNNYEEMVLTLKNLYGTFEISDKAIRASENSAGAFVNLLNAEMDGLIKSSNFNFGRMLYGDGTGVLATVSTINNGIIVVNSVQNLEVGMVLDFIDEDGEVISGATQRRILMIDRKNKYVKITGENLILDDVPEGTAMVIQGSYNKELSGLGAIFKTSGNLYGLSRSTNPWLAPYIATSVGSITEVAIQKAIDTIEENSGSKVNFILCSFGVRRALQALFATNSRNVDTLELNGGYKAISYNGIPIIADRMCPTGTMYLLNTNDFALHQLCDWQWLEGDDGKVIKQIAGKPVYSATLVKYADLMCSRPAGQGMLSGITEA